MSLQIIKQRVELYQQIRKFMEQRGIIEVEVPLLHRYATSNPFIQSFSVADNLFLQTSPELFLKKLLAQGFKDVFTICKCFRQAESGALHNPEFTMLEYYRSDFNAQDLGAEVLKLLQVVLGKKQKEAYSYCQFFQKYWQIDPFVTSLQKLQQMVERSVKYASGSTLSRDDCLDWLLVHSMQQKQQSGFITVTDFPKSQAELARIERDSAGREVSKRFEIYCDGLELANGYYELNDSKEHQIRIESDMKQRKQNGLPIVSADEAFIKASDDIGNCAGVAIGLDRILMLQTASPKIAEVLLFPWNRL